MTPSLPSELREVLAENEPARTLWDKLSPSHQREYGEWIADAKAEVTRRRRAQNAADMLVRKAAVSRSRP